MVAENRIGIVTVTFNSEPVIEEFLDSIAIQTHSDYLMYVVDNASKDKSVGLVRERMGNDPRCIVIANERNLGIAVGNNIGIERALADGCSHVLLLNNDTTFGSDLLSGLLAASGKLNAPMLVPKITFADPSDTLWCAGGRFIPLRGYATEHCGEGEKDSGQYDTARTIEYAPTCCMLIRRQVFEEIGLMDERYFVYYDDVDFCFRALRQGVKLWYSPMPTLAHKVSSLTGGSFSTFSVTQLTRGKVIFMRKHFKQPLRSALLALYQVFICRRMFSSAYGGLKSFRISQAAFMDGLRVNLDG